MLTYLKILIWRKGVHRLINLFGNEKRENDGKGRGGVCLFIRAIRPLGNEMNEVS